MELLFLIQLLFLVRKYLFSTMEVAWQLPPLLHIGVEILNIVDQFVEAGYF
jgi:hypothetical protein